MATNENGESRSTKVAEDVAALLRSRAPLVWVITQEEARVEGYLARAAKSAGYQPYAWDCAAGVTDLLSGQAQEDLGGTDPGAVLSAIEARVETVAGRGCFIFRDLPIWLDGGIQTATTVRQIKNLARRLPQVASRASQVIIVVTNNPVVPNDLKGAAVINWPLPDRQEIGRVLDESLAVLSEEQRAQAEPKNGTREEAIQAAIGLTGDQAAACYAKSLVQFKCIEPQAVANEKKQVIAAEGTITWYDPIENGLDAVGGLEHLKAWLEKRKSAFGAKAREYGLPAPRGAFIVGVPGCGKSLLCKAVATRWRVPLLKIDLGALKGSLVGESERKIRKAFEVVDAVGRCVVWFDEVEKALEGATQGGADGGVSADALGTILTWMQERKGESFVVATANRPDKLPPEFYRKGRFDDTWWVDLPNRDERVAILKTALKSKKRDAIPFDYEVISERSETFTGAEVAELVTSALFDGFEDGGREITTQDLLNAAESTYPLAKTAAEQIAAIRAWSQGRARPASRKVEKTQSATAGRQIEF
jgi:hypothetical protein